MPSKIRIEDVNESIAEPTEDFNADVGEVEETMQSQTPMEIEPEILHNKMQTEKKIGKLITCPVCNKEMLEKTYKYTHSLKCKLPEPPPPPPPPPKKIRAKPKPAPVQKTKQDEIVVDFDHTKPVKLAPAPTPEMIRVDRSRERLQQRQERIMRLISRAF